MTTTSLIISSYPWKSSLSKDKKEKDGDYEDLRSNIEKIAEKDLRETKSTKEQSLIQLKEWIKKNKNIENCLMDDAFLSRFLRVKKYSTPMAQQVLLKYLNLRKRYKNIFYNLDYMDPAIYDIINSGYILPSPFRDANGRRVIMYAIRNFDSHKFTSRDMAKVHAITYETLLDEDENQILGFTHVGDGNGINASHITMWSISEFATLLKWGEQSYPMRHKEIHIINMPSTVKYVYDFAMTRISSKVQQRLKIHSNLEDLHKIVDKRVLPKEYGGVMPMVDMIDLWKKELAQKRDRLLSLDSMNLLSDEDIITSRTKQGESEMDKMQGSFRKLEID